MIPNELRNKQYIADSPYKKLWKFSAFDGRSIRPFDAIEVKNTGQITLYHYNDRPETFTSRDDLDTELKHEVDNQIKSMLEKLCQLWKKSNNRHSKTQKHYRNWLQLKTWAKIKATCKMAKTYRPRKKFFYKYHFPTYHVDNAGRIHRRHQGTNSKTEYKRGKAHGKKQFRYIKKENMKRKREDRDDPSPKRLDF